MATLVFDQEYRIARDTPSDINEHIEVLRNLADSVEHVTEMGTVSYTHLTLPTTPYV